MVVFLIDCINNCVYTYIKVPRNRKRVHGLYYPVLGGVVVLRGFVHSTQCVYLYPYKTKLSSLFVYTIAYIH